jgi:hypothetical protein
MPVSYFILCDLWTYVTFRRAVAIRAVNTLPASASRCERQDDVWLSLQPVTFPSSPKAVIAFAYSAQSAIAANKTSGLPEAGSNSPCRLPTVVERPMCWQRTCDPPALVDALFLAGEIRGTGRYGISTRQRIGLTPP